jgi:hypothetical protein
MKLADFELADHVAVFRCPTCGYPSVWPLDFESDRISTVKEIYKGTQAGRVVHAVVGDPARYDARLLSIVRDAMTLGCEECDEFAVYRHGGSS